MLYNNDHEDLFEKARQARVEDLDQLPDDTVRLLAETISAGQDAEASLARPRRLPRGTRRALLAVVDAGRAARERLLLANLRLIPWEIDRRNLYCRGMELTDLWQEGVIGLNRAIDTFDPDRAAFSTYAPFWIRQTVSRAIANTGRIVRLPVHVEEARRSGRDDYEEFAARFDNVESIDLFRMARRPESPIEDPDGDADIIEFADLVLPAIPGPSDAVVGDATVEWMLGQLTEKEAEILRRRNGIGGDPETLEEIGRSFGVTRERIRQIEKQAIAKLQRRLGNEAA